MFLFTSSPFFLLPPVLRVPAHHFCRRGGRWNLGIVQSREGGWHSYSLSPVTRSFSHIFSSSFFLFLLGRERCQRFLHADIRQLQKHSTGSTEGNSASNSLWGEYSFLWFVQAIRAKNITDINLTDFFFFSVCFCLVVLLWKNRTCDWWSIWHLSQKGGIGNPCLNGTRNSINNL